MSQAAAGLGAVTNQRSDAIWRQQRQEGQEGGGARVVRVAGGGDMGGWEGNAVRDKVTGFPLK